MKKLFLLLIISVGILVLLFVLPTVKSSNNQTLYAANFSIYDALKAIAPADAEIKLFIPAGEDIHSLQPNPRMLASASKSKRLFYVKGSVSGWLEKVLDTSASIPFSDLSLGIDFIEAKDHHEHDHEKHGSAYDPHYWLNINNQLIIAKNILKELKTLYPEELSFMQERYKSYEKSLNELDGENKKLLSQCQNRTIIVTHNAFSYLAKSYDFQVRSIVGLTPESLSNPKKLKQIIDLIKEKTYTTIFFEDFISDRMAKTVAKEVKVSIETLHPLATLSQKSLNQGKSYRDLMRENISKIAKAMQCR